MCSTNVRTERRARAHDDQERWRQRVTHSPWRSRLPSFRWRRDADGAGDRKVASSNPVRASNQPQVVPPGGDDIAAKTPVRFQWRDWPLPQECGVSTSGSSPPHAREDTAHAPPTGTEIPPSRPRRTAVALLVARAKRRRPNVTRTSTTVAVPSGNSSEGAESDPEARAPHFAPTPPPPPRGNITGR